VPIRNPEPSKSMSRREALKLAGIASGALASGAFTQRKALADGKPEKTDITLGFIPLTDCSPLVIASEKGIYKKYGLNVRIKKMASWGATRDAIQKGEIDGSHILLGMVVASTLGVGDVGSPTKKVPMCALQCLNINGQAITLKKTLLDAGIKTPADVKKQVAEKGAKYTFAMTFPTGTHAMWMRYWLASGGVHPDKDVKLITIPPPQMVANMKTGNMDGYCVGEPWNARAVIEGIGGTATTTQAMWKNHPEKVLGVTEDFAKANPNTCAALIAATLEASQWLDDLKNRPEAAQIVGKNEYVNCASEVILGRLLGDYIHTLGTPIEKDPDYMRFFERNASVPYLSHAIWFMAQHRRWGMLTEKPDYTAEAKKMMRHDLYTAGCKMAGVAVPDTMESRGVETFFDGVAFDPANAEAYAQGFAIKA